MIYTQKEIFEAHKQVKKDIDQALDTAKGIDLAIECQTLVLNHLRSMMDEKTEEKVEETTEEKPEEEEQAKE